MNTTKTTLHIIWGREAVSRYKLGLLDNHVRLAYSTYDFKSPELSESFLRGVREARDPDDWMVITNSIDIQKLGMPMRNRLIEAAKRGDVDAVKSMLKSGVKLDASDEKGLSALHHAAQSGQADVIHVLVDAGANVDAPASNSLGKTPLHLACESDLPGTALAVVVLIQMGADPNARDSNGNTPLHSTLSSSDNRPGSADTKTQALLQSGADPRHENNLNNKAKDIISVALKGSPALVDKVIAMLILGERDLEARELSRLSAVRRMAPGSRQDGIVRPV